MIPFKPSEPKSGIYDTITNYEYHRVLTGIVSKSYLVKFLQCPAAAKVADKDTDDMRFGRAMHPFILEGQEAFDKEFAVMPDFPCPEGQNPKGWKNTTKYKELRSAWESSVIGKEVITHEQFQTIIAMNSGVKSNPVAKAFLSQGCAEVTLIWQDPETGIWCKSRPDLMVEETQDFGDLKKSQRVTAHGFQSSMVKFGYYVQAGMAFEGMRQITGDKWNAFTMIAVRDVEPYQCEVHPLDMDWINLGFNEFKRLLRLEAMCREQNFWPNYTPANWTDLRRAKCETLLVPGYMKPEGMPWELQEVES
jgi:exodeoxyribonuclease VIII